MSACASTSSTSAATRTSSTPSSASWALRRANRPFWERTPEASEDEDEDGDDDRSSASSEDDRRAQIDAHEKALADAEAARRAKADAKRRADSDVGGSMGLFLDASGLVAEEATAEKRAQEEAAAVRDVCFGVVQHAHSRVRVPSRL